MTQISGPKIVVIGGGTGSYTVLRSLKNYTSQITALVSMVDNGGSTGQLRDEYGVLPAGDVRQCLVALSNSTLTMRNLFNYRFGEGSFDGHNFGNVFLAAVEKITDDFGQGVTLAGDILNITGRVIPITLDNTNLVLLDGDKEIVGEHSIDSLILKSKVKPELTLRPHAWLNPKAKKAIYEADIVVIAPGSLYESLVSSLIVDGVREALNETSAKLVQIVNLVTKPGQTDGWDATDYLNEIERFTGKDSIDYLLYNVTKPSQEMIDQYARDGEYPVTMKNAKKINTSTTCKMVGLDLITFYDIPQNPNDKLAVERTLIRHDGDKVARQLMKIFYS
jgi:uncharacterized cofD-like protein